jgi:hypothetical protein
MQTLKAYLYSIILEVQIPDPTIFNLRKRLVYSDPIKIYQGVDNTIQILISNQDNKPLDLTGYYVQAYIQDPEEQNTIADFSVEFFDEIKGHGLLVINKDTVNSLDQRIYKLTLKRFDSETEEETAIYTDVNYGIPIDLVVLPGYYS